MPVNNAHVARIFEEIANLLEIGSANPFRVRAYRVAARTVESLPDDVGTLIERGEDLTKLPGIGADLAAKVRDIVETGTTPMLNELHKSVPPIATELLKIPGLGPKRVRTLYEELDIHTLEQLHRAALDGRIRARAGFGEGVERNILHGLETRQLGPERFRLATAAPFSEALTAYLGETPGVDRAVVAGSYRRGRETVGDLDILVTAERSGPVMDRFVAFHEVAEIMSKGRTRATVILRGGLQVDLRVVAAESYGAALHYFTGSKAHNIAIRRLAQQKGLKINEYGVFRGKKAVAGKTEESVFQSVGLAYIPPELREDRGEIQAARARNLPKLVELSDLKGDLHVHTNYTDGQDSISDIAAGAQRRGFQYVAITDHSRRLKMVHGLTAKRLRAQIEEIDRANAGLKGITVLKGIEVDILEDGSLDLPDDILGQLDFVIGAIHSRFNLSREKQTERILRAFDHPHFTLLAHPSGRLIPTREPYDVDMPRLIRAAAQRRCFLELNAHPERLDLIDTYCRTAKTEGVLVAISSDAHRISGMDNLRFGIMQARRGWLEKEDVLNTRPLHALKRLLAGTM